MFSYSYSYKGRVKQKAVNCYLVLCDVVHGSCMYVGHYTDASTSINVKHMNGLVRTGSQSYVCIQYDQLH